MDTDKWIGLVLGGAAMIGGMAIAAIAIVVSVPAATKEKLAKLEAATRERLAMIEKGINPETIFKARRTPGQDPLLWGLLLAGMGLGIIIGYVLHLLTGGNREVLVNGLAILFGGIGLVQYRMLNKKLED
jgi:hypothetical protein